VSADADLLKPYGVTANNFSLVVARPEPENSLLEIVQAFSYCQRDHYLIVLGNLTPKNNKYHDNVMSVASNEVLFLGAIYDADIVDSLRLHSRFYLHGHRVGGTNPSLVEALGAGCAVIAHDNIYTRWVAGSAAVYFKDEASLTKLFDSMLLDTDTILEMKAASCDRFGQQFTWTKVLDSYHELLTRYYPT
jgi:glycosyltransferase involved in cell wall biosynthesis